MGKKLKEIGTTSLFDPYLCKLIYSWFTKENDLIFDPFAGGAVRGIIAGSMNRKYLGCDIRQEQIEENYKILDLNQLNIKPIWKNIDSVKYNHSEKYDFVFSCPPYGNLEKYSDIDGDISNLEYNSFIESYSEIISKSLKNLKDNSFACFVVGDFRNKKGNYNGFVRDTEIIFKNNNCHLYNEFILINTVGTLRLRVGKQFDSSRKNGKCHQNILVFIKGDAKKATDKIKQL